MCGRFTLTVHHIGDLVTELGAEIDPTLLEAYRPRYNIAPGDTHLILRKKEGRRQFLPADWGLINHWSQDPSVAFKQINARAETLAQRAAYREAFKSRRCLLPADGFYEWRGPKREREPVWFHAPDRSILWLAGLYEGWVDPDSGELRRTFTIVTTAANELVRPIHDRMPAIVSASRIDEWLDGPPSAGLLGPAAEGVLVFDPASPRVNSAAHDDPDLLDPDDPEVKRQLRLF